MNKMQRTYTTRYRGMALLEVLVAMLLFALAILPLVRLQVMSMDATKAGYFKTETATAVQSVMDYFVNDKESIFDNGWTDIVVQAGDNCSTADTDLKKTICNILNGQYEGHDTNDANIHNEKNAVLCVYQENPPSHSDQRLLSIRAIWYIGKRQDDGKSASESDYYNSDLTAQDCGTNYASAMDSPALSKQNIDYLQINMAY